MAQQHLEAVAKILEEQDRNDPIDDTESVCDYVERDAASELLFDSMLETTDLLDGEVMMEFEESELSEETGNGQAPLSQVQGRTTDGKSTIAKLATVGKPRRERMGNRMALKKRGRSRKQTKG